MAITSNCFDPGWLIFIRAKCFEVKCFLRECACVTLFLLVLFLIALHLHDVLIIAPLQLQVTEQK